MSDIGASGPIVGGNRLLNWFLWGLLTAHRPLTAQVGRTDRSAAGQIL